MPRQLRERTEDGFDALADFRQPRSGSTCRLSGGRKWSPGPARSAKYCHVCRAISRSSPACSAVGDSTSRASAGWLARHAKIGAANHSTKNGAATVMADGSARSNTNSAHAVIASAAYMLRTKLVSVIDALACTCAAEFHSSRRCRTTSRPSVRTMASSISKQSRGSIASWNSVRPKPCSTSSRSMRSQWPRSVLGRGTCRSISPRTVGSRNASSASTPKRWPPAPSAIHDTQSSRKRLGATRVRRRLSSIFHWAIGESWRLRRPAIHGSSCQSPRAHRWLRAAATSVCAGNSSNSSMSLTNPHRA